jgi:hypothetical protein
MRITEVGAVGLFVGAACGLAYAKLQSSLRRSVAEQQASTDRQLAAMATTIKSLQMRVAELNRQTVERSAEIAAIKKTSEDNSRASEAMTPELLAVITAAATAFLGKTPRIRSAKLVPVYPSGLMPVHASVSAWTQQGRMIVQASHNLRTRD